MGISGGMVPCYDAISVMLIAFSLNRLGMGIALIAVFSLGLASVIILLAIAFSKSSVLLNYVSDHNLLIKYIPLLSSGLIIILGAVVMIRSFI